MQNVKRLRCYCTVRIAEEMHRSGSVQNAKKTYFARFPDSHRRHCLCRMSDV